MAKIRTTILLAASGAVLVTLGACGKKEDLKPVAGSAPPAPCTCISTFLPQPAIKNTKAAIHAIRIKKPSSNEFGMIAKRSRHFQHLSDFAARIVRMEYGGTGDEDVGPGSNHTR